MRAARLRKIVDVLPDGKGGLYRAVVLFAPEKLTKAAGGAVSNDGNGRLDFIVALIALNVDAADPPLPIRVHILGRGLVCEIGACVQGRIAQTVIELILGTTTPKSYGAGCVPAYRTVGLSALVPKRIPQTFVLECAMSPSPIRARARNARGVRPSPQTLARGKRLRSMSSVESPRVAAWYAHAEPAGPAPTTTMS